MSKQQSTWDRRRVTIEVAPWLVARLGPEGPHLHRFTVGEMVPVTGAFTSTPGSTRTVDMLGEVVSVAEDGVATVALTGIGDEPLSTEDG